MLSYSNHIWDRSGGPVFQNLICVFERLISRNQHLTYDMWFGRKWTLIAYAKSISRSFESYLNIRIWKYHAIGRFAPSARISLRLIVERKGLGGRLSYLKVRTFLITVPLIEKKAFFVFTSSGTLRTSLDLTIIRSQTKSVVVYFQNSFEFYFICMQYLVYCVFSLFVSLFCAYHGESIYLKCKNLGKTRVWVPLFHFYSCTAWNGIHVHIETRKALKSTGII